MVPNWLMKRSDISPGAKLAYGRLAQFEGRTGTAKAKQSTIGTELGVSERQVRDYVNELIAARLIVIERIGKVNRYFFLEHSWMVMRDPENQTCRKESAGDEPNSQMGKSSDHRKDGSGEHRKESSGEYRRDSSAKKRVVLEESSETSQKTARSTSSALSSQPRSSSQVVSFFLELNPSEGMERAAQVAARFIKINTKNGNEWSRLRNWKAAARGFNNRVRATGLSCDY